MAFLLGEGMYSGPATLRLRNMWNAARQTCAHPTVLLVNARV
jgi:hypothetical protein